MNKFEHVQGSVSLYDEVQVRKLEQVQVVVTWEHPPSPRNRQDDRQIRVKTLPAHNFVGGRK